MQSTLSYFTFTIIIEANWYVLCIQTRKDSYECCFQRPGRFLGIIGQNPSVSKSNRLLILIFGVFIYYIEVCSIDSHLMMGSFPEALNFNWLFFKLNRFICN